jgi:RimJ/RimL family protein N-acetyltransferase
MFRGEKVVLRSYDKKDLEKAHAFFNDYRLTYYLAPGLALPLSVKEEETFIENVSSGKDKERAYTFAIDTLEGEYIGGCGYFNLSRKNGTVFIGIAIGNPVYWGKGYGTDAMRVLLRFLFDEFNIRKVLLNVFAFNERAIASYKKLGFVEEGRLREQMYREGTYHDEVVMGLFRSEFRRVTETKAGGRTKSKNPGRKGKKP